MATIAHPPPPHVGLRSCTAVKVDSAWSAEEVLARVTAHASGGEVVGEDTVAGVRDLVGCDAPRRFDAHDLYLLSIGFDVPIAYFFVPPPLSLAQYPGGHRPPHRGALRHVPRPRGPARCARRAPGRRRRHAGRRRAAHPASPLRLHRGIHHVGRALPPLAGDADERAILKILTCLPCERRAVDSQSPWPITFHRRV